MCSLAFSGALFLKGQNATQATVKAEVTTKLSASRTVESYIFQGEPIHKFLKKSWRNVSNSLLDKCGNSSEHLSVNPGNRGNGAKYKNLCFQNGRKYWFCFAFRYLGFISLHLRFVKPIVLGLSTLIVTTPYPSPATSAHSNTRLSLCSFREKWFFGTPFCRNWFE